MNDSGTISAWQNKNFSLPYQGGSMPLIQKDVPWQWGMKQKIQGKSMIMHKPIMNGGTMNVATLGTPNLTGGTYANGIINAPRIIDMTAINSALGTIIDAIGLLSSTNFPNGGASGNTTITTTSLTPTDITGSSQSLVLTRSAYVLTIATGIGLNSFAYNAFGNGMQFQLIDSLNGTLSSVPMYGQWITFGSNIFGYDQVATAESLELFSAGTHTLKLQYYALRAGTAALDNWEWIYLVLGS